MHVVAALCTITCPSSSSYCCAVLCCVAPCLGVDTFDLYRLESAVASIPASQYKGEQQALTQTSHSMVFRWGGGLWVFVCVCGGGGGQSRGRGVVWVL